jgi:hypothetical protein
VAERNLFEDDPIADMSQDFIGRSAFVGQIIDVLDRVRRTGSSVVLSLIGPWGSGKSSVLRLLMEHIDSDDTWLVVKYNPWVYSDFQSILSGFFGEIREALPSGAKWSNLRKNLGELGKAVSPLGKLTSLVGFDSSLAIEKLGSIVSGDQSFEKVHAKAEEALKEAGKPILVVIDDLDRLLPDELLGVFRLIRNIGRMPGLHYLLSYDEATLLDVIERTPVAAGSPARARDYLEKMVQVRLDLPPLRERQVEMLIDETLLRVARQVESLGDRLDRERLSSLLVNVLRPRLRTARSIKRFFAQVESAILLVGLEVDFVDFLLVTFLRTYEPKLYAAMSAMKSGMIYGLNGAKGASGGEVERSGEWLKVLYNVGVQSDSVNGILSCLADIFLPIRLALNGSDASGETWMNMLVKRRSVGHPDYFDRYFTYGVHADDWSDEEVISALLALGAERSSTEVDRLFNSLKRDPVGTVRKIQAQEGRVSLPANLLLLLGDVYADLTRAGRESMVESRAAFEALARRLLDVSESAGPEIIVKLIDRGVGGVFLSATIVWDVEYRDRPDDGNLMRSRVGVALLDHVRELVVDSRDYFQMVEAIYHGHQVRIGEDVAGIVRSALDAPEEVLGVAVELARAVYANLIGSPEDRDVLRLLKLYLGGEFLLAGLREKLDEFDARQERRGTDVESRVLGILADYRRDR